MLSWVVWMHASSLLLSSAKELSGVVVEVISMPKRRGS